MVAAVTIKTNTIQLSKTLERIQKEFPNAIKQALANVSALQIRNIRDRTQRKGVSVFGSPFQKYSFSGGYRYFLYIGCGRGELMRGSLSNYCWF